MRAVRRHRDDEVLEGASPRARPRSGRSTPGGPTIGDLQQLAGNRSVAGLLAGHGPDALRVAVQRDDGRAGDPGDEGASSSAVTLSFPQLDVVLPALSFSWRGQGQGSGSRKGFTTEADVTADVGDQATRFASLASSGRGVGDVVADFGGRYWYTLRDVFIAGYRLGANRNAPVVSMTLAFQGMAFKQRSP